MRNGLRANPASTNAAPALAGPLYLQVHDHLRARVVSGEWTTAMMLPNELEFAREYGVSIGTMRKALDRLGQARLIIRKQGRGTYVRNNAAEPMARFPRWHVEPKDGPRSESVLSVRVVRPSAAETQRLRLARSESVLKVDTLGVLGANCAILNAYTLARRPAHSALADTMDAKEGALAHITSAMTRATRCVDRVTAAKASAAQAKTLDISEGEPVLCVARAGFDADERPVFLCDSIAYIANGAAYSPDLD